MTKHAPVFRAVAAAVLAVSAAAGCGADADPAVKSAAPQSNASRTASQAAVQTAATQAEVTKQLTRLETTRRTRIGAYAIDTGSGRAVGHRADETFPFASTFKAMACGAVLRKARQSAPGLLDKVIHYTKDDLQEFSPVTEKHVDTGMTVAELCHATITQSDNTAGNLILKRIGGPSGFTRFLRGIGDRTTRLDRWETDLNAWSPGSRRDTTTPKAIARDLRLLTVGDALHPADRARLIAWMRQTATGANRIRAGLPATWKIGDKTGSSPVYGCANDIAIAYPPSARPLIIAVYTNRHDRDRTYDEKIIARTTTILAQALGKKV